MNCFDRICSSFVATSAATIFAFNYKLWEYTESVGNLCQKISGNVGMQAFSDLIPSKANHLLFNSCAKVLEYTNPMKELCFDVNKLGFGIFERVMPQGLTPLIKDSCIFIEQHSGEMERICREINSIGLSAFDKIGSLELKAGILDNCATFDAGRQLLIIPIVISGTLTLYYLYRTLAPKRCKP